MRRSMFVFVVSMAMMTGCSRTVQVRNPSQEEVDSKRQTASEAVSDYVQTFYQRQKAGYCGSGN